jgi:glycosyltransferase involved in cell wall biosynthesis
MYIKYKKIKEVISLDYILITAAKNEDKNISTLIKSIINQSSRPKVWLIVDDGSTDTTPQIIQNSVFENSWILSIRLNDNKRDIGLHIAEVLKLGFEYLKRYCLIKDISYEFVGIIDADMVPEYTYFEKLLKYFYTNPKLGIISGGVYYNDMGKLIWEKSRSDHARGGSRLIREDCLKEIGYIPAYAAWDTVMNVKAKKYGWCVQQFKDVVSIQSRKTNTGQGLWKGWVSFGERMYYLNYHPILMIGAVFSALIKKPHFICIPLFYGYFISIIQRKDQINDKEIKDYFWNDRMKEIIKNLKYYI